MGVQRLKPTAGGATIKSIQRGTIAFLNDSGAAVTATITAVDTSLAILTPLGYESNTSATGGASGGARLAFTNATTVTATRHQGGTDASINDCTVGYQVTEWQQG